MSRGQFKSLPRLSDPAELSNDQRFLDLIGTETLIYINKIRKASCLNLFQQRIFTVTDKAIYNIHNYKIKSKILFTDIIGISKAL